jgi:hypothetical protein
MLPKDQLETWAQSIVMAVSAGQIRAKFREVRRKEAKKSKHAEGVGKTR